MGRSFVNDGIYEPQMLTYTDPYARVYTIGGDGSLQSIRDVAGSTLTITAAGIIGSNNLAVPFLRDGQGRFVCGELRLEWSEDWMVGN